ncbi:MAG TPA: neuraminidase-like domain-containing protein, partial [Limnochordia bacterium]
EHEEENEADDVVHVIARTAGARRTYYYRRFEYSAWTPWERVDVNIEGDPVLPVVWKGRLFLFWTSVLQESPPKQAAPTGNASKKLSDLTASDLSGEVNVEVKVSLYWSERYHGKWQPPRSSDVNKPLSVGSFSATGANGFDRAKLTLASSEAPSGALKIAVSYPGKTGGTFTLYNTHSLPVRDVDEVTDPSDSPIVFLISRSRQFSAPPQPFTITYFDPALPWPEMNFDRKLFERIMLYRAVAPHHLVSDAFTAPFFFQDGRHAFFVRTKERRVYVGGYIDVGIRNPPLVVTEIPPLIAKPDIPRPPVDGWRPHDGAIGGVAGPIGPVIFDAADPGLVIPYLAEHSYIDRAIARAGAVRFGERLIGPGGSVALDSRVR